MARPSDKRLPLGILVRTGGLADETASLSGSMARVSRVEARVERGLRQFATALFNAALSEPRQIRTLHPQYISFLESEQPTKTAHPVATLLLVKLPLRVLATLLIASCVQLPVDNPAYVATAQEIDEDFARMRDEPVALRRPVVVLSGYRSPIGASAGLGRRPCDDVRAAEHATR